MNYKVGDKVRIKKRGWNDEAKQFLNSLDPPYVITVGEVINGAVTLYRTGYFAKEDSWPGFIWMEYDIDGMEYQMDTDIPVNNRFELLDL